MKKTAKIVVGLSGGVDSAVTALLLKQQGHDVTGIYMQNWEVENDDPYCTIHQDQNDARAVCEHLNIPFHTINFAQQYWDNVFQYCLDEFVAGRTPNPDIWCNKEIKFKVFLERVLHLGADFLATGHYTNIEHNKSSYQIHKGVDKNKDQSYFLYTLGQKELKHALFPLGGFTKSQVRQIAKKAGLLNYAKKDSTGICFIGERKFKEFLNEFLLTQPGDMETPEGKVIGRHDGLMFYTIGQRKGLNIGGHQDALGRPWYVLSKDIKRNILMIGQGNDHPLLFSQHLICEQMHWIKGMAPKTPLHCTAKTRYRQVEQSCLLSKIGDNLYQVEFEQPQRAITPGQSVVFYQDDVCLGGGVIKN